MAVFQSRGLPRNRSILAVYLIVLVILIAAVTSLVPRLTRDVRKLAGEIPSLISTFQRYAAMIHSATTDYDLPPGLTRALVGFLQRSEKVLVDAGDNLFTYFTSSATFLSYIVIAPVIAYYILLDMNLWRQRGLLFAARYPLPYMDLLRDVDGVVSGFVRGQSIVAFSVFLMAWAASAILGLGYGAVLGFLAGLGEFIPFAGPIIGAVPFLLAALAKSPQTMAWSLGAVVLIQWIDANLIVPRITGPRVGLHPLWILFALLAGADLFGFWGLLLAVPVAGIAGALVKFARALRSTA